MTARGWIAAALAAALLAGCQNKDDRVAFDGKYYSAKVSLVEKQRDVFVVTVRDLDQGIDGARATAEYEGVAYCVRTFGSSKIDRAVGPDTPAAQLRIADGTLSYQGTCPQ